MGQNASLSSSLNKKLNRNFFDFQNIIGKGGFGKVWKVVYKRNQKVYAWKEMSKVKIIDKKSEKSIKGERDLLSKLHNPFIVNMIYAFQDYENLYWVMDYLMGGDLRFHISKNRKFTEEQTKFIIACLWLGWEYLHGKNIIHRDIKPENLVWDSNGYIKITDFGVAKIRQPDNSSQTSGTPGYMAPEVLCGNNHSFPVDFFAIGVMGYEFMFGQRPYLGKNRKEVKQEILRKQVVIKDDMLPSGWSDKSQDFINKCLERKESKRWGFNLGIKEWKEHSWYQGFEWGHLLDKSMSSPFKIINHLNYDKKYCESIDKISPETFERYQSYMAKDNFNSIFFNYTYGNQGQLDNHNNESTKTDHFNNNYNTNNTRPLKWTTSTACTQYNGDKQSPKLQINQMNQEINANKNKYLRDFNNDKSSDDVNHNNMKNNIISNNANKLNWNNGEVNDDKYTLVKDNNSNTVKWRKLSKNYSYLNMNNNTKDRININNASVSRDYNNNSMNDIHQIREGKGSNNNSKISNSNNKSIILTNKSFIQSSKLNRNNNCSSPHLNWEGIQSSKLMKCNDSPKITPNNNNSVLPIINSYHNINNIFPYKRRISNSMNKQEKNWKQNRRNISVNPWFSSSKGYKGNWYNNLNGNLNNSNNYKVYIQKRLNGSNSFLCKMKSINNNNNNIL